MSKYTTEIRFICESLAGKTDEDETGFDTIDNTLNIAVGQIFDFDYPIFDETYKTPLEKKILSYYYTREICEETYGLWKLRLKNKMNLIMPYYNQLYESALIKFDPLHNTNLTRDYRIVKDGEKTGVTASEATGEQDAIRKYSDTPQGSIQNLENDTYLTNATINKNNSTSTGDVTFNETFNNVDEYIEHITGKTAGVNFSKDILDFRKTFLNIDEMIINDLNDLFFGLW